MRTFKPCYVDHFQSPTYRLVSYTLDSSGAITAHFADGSSRPSVFDTLKALFDAGKDDWRERVIETTPISLVAE